MDGQKDGQTDGPTKNIYPIGILRMRGYKNGDEQFIS